MHSCLYPMHSRLDLLAVVAVNATTLKLQLDSSFALWPAFQPVRIVFNVSVRAGESGSEMATDQSLICINNALYKIVRLHTTSSNRFAMPAVSWFRHNKLPAHHVEELSTHGTAIYLWKSTAITCNTFERLCLDKESNGE